MAKVGKIVAADSSTEMSLDEEGRLGRNQIAQRISSSHYDALLGAQVVLASWQAVEPAPILAVATD